MAKVSHSSVNADFEQVLSYLSSLRVIEENPASDVRELAKKVHACTYSMILWKFKLGKLTAHSSPFIEEVASDALQILPHFLLGFGKTTKILARGLLENTLRFVYYSDHPVEFRIMNQEEKKYIGVEELFRYVRCHPDYTAAEKKFDALNRMSSLYDVLSAGIHGRRVVDLEMRSSLQKIHLDKAAALKEAEIIAKCCEAANFVLAVYNRAKMQAFSLEDRRVVLRTMPRKARDAWSGLDDHA